MYVVKFWQKSEQVDFSGRERVKLLSVLDVTHLI